MYLCRLMHTNPPQLLFHLTELFLRFTLLSGKLRWNCFPFSIKFIIFFFKYTTNPFISNNTPPSLCCSRCVCSPISLPLSPSSTPFLWQRSLTPLYLKNTRNPWMKNVSLCFSHIELNTLRVQEKRRLLQWVLVWELGGQQHQQVIWDISCYMCIVWSFFSWGLSENITG